MPNVFNAAEVMDMGIEKEKRRRDFYAFVAERFKDKALKELFSNLKGWEEAHIKKFTVIRNGLEESETFENYQGELEAYMRALVDDMLYDQVSPKSFAENVGSPSDAIRYGIGFEKDAILFFNELVKYIAPAHRDKVQELIEEEKKHIAYLSELKKKYG